MPLDYNPKPRYISRKQNFIENVYRRRHLTPLQIIQERREQSYQRKREMLDKFIDHNTIDDKTKENK